MAWKRGTQNNAAGEIRKGHIKEFLLSNQLRAEAVTAPLHVLCTTDAADVSYARVATRGFPDVFLPFVHDDVFVYLHPHKHPRTVFRCVLDDTLAPGTIALTEAQRINGKVCVGEDHTFSAYTGDSFAYDAREGAIGDTEVRPSQPTSAHLAIDARPLARQFGAQLAGCVVSCEDVYSTLLHCNPGTGGAAPVVEGEAGEVLEVVGRVASVWPLDDDNDTEEEEGDDDEDEEENGGGGGGGAVPYTVREDCYRGVVGPDTEVFLALENADVPWQLAHARPVPAEAPPANTVSVGHEGPVQVTVWTRDEQEFPVRRRLLRPCIALTSVVQRGRGKYRQDGEDGGGGGVVRVDMDACTFDKVLLYLEHEARAEPFKFDPLLAHELRDAALALGVAGLQEACDRVLGSFQERVRKTPIPLAEVRARNDAGTAAAEKKCFSATGQGRGETLLLIDGMVLDVTRWLPEHPGGSHIIPTQALNVDSTGFFEIYHASRQSFLYLKEFYIGELAAADRPLVPQPRPELSGGAHAGNSSSSSSGGVASAAFYDQLRRHTTWRLDVNEMEEQIVPFFKSF